jgi:uncharacterized protein (TIGR03435 family)
MRTLAVLLLVSLVTTLSAAQEFEVASVKPAVPTRPLGDFGRRAPPGQWNVVGLTLQEIITYIYPEFRLPGLLMGGPAWVRATRFDLQGRMSPTATPAEVKAMVRRLLEQRFGLRTHTEQRMLDVFVLTLAQPGKPGPGLTPASPVCVEWRKNGGAVPADCDLQRKGVTSGLTMPVETIADFITMLSLPAAIPRGPVDRFILDRPIVDRTGLDGYFQIVGPSPMASNPSFVSDMERELGLKLTRAREAVDVMVIESVSMPEPD